jgi:putative intracellular protease/amidase
VHAQIVLFDGFDPMDVVGPYEVLYAGGSRQRWGVERRTRQRGGASDRRERQW